jgi:hypothetical protein
MASYELGLFYFSKRTEQGYGPAGTAIDIIGVERGLERIPLQTST